MCIRVREQHHLEFCQRRYICDPLDRVGLPFEPHTQTHHKTTLQIFYSLHSNLNVLKMCVILNLHPVHLRAQTTHAYFSWTLLLVLQLLFVVRIISTASLLCLVSHYEEYVCAMESAHNLTHTR